MWSRLAPGFRGLPSARSPSQAAVILLLGFLYFAISYSTKHYWDEYFYLYSVAYHHPADLFRSESDLSLFPSGFFSTKAAFVYLLYGLIGIAGNGQLALILVRSLFSLMFLATAIASFALLRELLPLRQAVYTAIVFLFLPVSIYLGFKVLSETPGALFATTASWAFLRSFRAKTRGQLWRFLGFASLALSFAVACRFTAITLFGGLVCGLLVAEAVRFPRHRVLLRAAVVSALCLCLVLLGYAAVGVGVQQLEELITSVTARIPSLGVKLFAVLMMVQGFALLMPWALKPPYSRQVVLAIVWAGVCVGPLVLASNYLEPRYFYTALVPLAMLIQPGLWRLAESLRSGRTAAVWVGLLVSIVVGNRLLLAPLMPYELDEQHYAGTVRELRERYPGATLLTPWTSDYCFLRFRFPDQPLRLAYSKPAPGATDRFRTEAFQRWVGEGRYVGTPEALEKVPCPRLYLGWTFNPAVLELEKRLAWIGVPLNITKSEGLKDHLAQSWMWHDPSLTMKLVVQHGDYRGFEVWRDGEACP